jgi:ATP-binding cassette subfamily B protein
MNNDLHLAKLLLDFAKPYTKVLSLIVVLLPLSSVAFSIQPFLIKKAIDGPLSNGNLDGLIVYVLYFLLALIINFTLQLAQIWLINSTGQKIVSDIRQKLFEHLERLPMTFFDKNPIGRSVTRLTSDVEQLSDSIGGGLILVLVDIFNIITVIIFMAAINIKLCLVLVAFMVPVIVIASVFQKSYRKASLVARQKLSKLNSFLQQNIVGIQVVQLLNCADKNINIYNESNQEYFKANDKSIWADANFSAGVELIGLLSLAAVLFISKEILLDNALTVGVIIAFLQYTQSLFDPIRSLSDRFTVIQSGFTAAERIDELLNEPITISDKQECLSLTDNQITSQYLIEFDDVWFSYDKKQWILQGLSFKVKAGEFIAIVGKTGSGKSTVIKLLTRLYDVDSGAIKINGVDIRDLKQDELRKFIAVIHQDSYIFAGNLEDNITLKRDHVNLALAKPFLSRLSLDLKSNLNERAANISSGEEQVISFARALVSNPELLILDEATAKIDLVTEAHIQAELAKYTHNKTLVVIAHRLETIRSATKVIEIKAGQAYIQTN